MACISMDDHCAAASPKVENFSVPVIDLDQLGDSRSRDLVIQDISEACKKIGCFEVCILATHGTSNACQFSQVD